MALQGVLKPFGRLASLLKILQDPENPEGPEILKNILKKKSWIYVLAEKTQSFDLKFFPFILKFYLHCISFPIRTKHFEKKTFENFFEKILDLDFFFPRKIRTCFCFLKFEFHYSFATAWPLWFSKEISYTRI